MLRSLPSTHFIAVLFIALIAYPYRLAQAGVMQLSTSEAVTYALAHNQDLAAARLKIDEARGQLLGSGRLANPELEVELRRSVRTSESSVQAHFMQRFPLTARLSLEKAVSKAQLAAAEAEVRDFERRLAADVRVLAIKVLAQNEKLWIIARRLANSLERAQFLAKRGETGEASSLELYQAELDRQQIKVESRRLSSESAALSNEMTFLVLANLRDVLFLSGSLQSPTELPPEDMSALSGFERPDLTAARHLAESAQKATDLAKARKWEDIGVGLIASRERTEDAPKGLSEDYAFGLRVSVPLPLWNRNEGGVAQARATALRAGTEAEALANSIQKEVGNTRVEMSNLAGLIEEMDTQLLPKANSLERALSESYSAGHSSFLDTLTARSRRLDLEDLRIDALRDYHLARNRYHAALGFPAETKK
jgi:cobalt-zinc-cadmium efflux system outer membrane protein